MHTLRVRIVGGPAMLAEALARRLSMEADIVVDACPSSRLSLDADGPVLDVVVAGGAGQKAEAPPPEAPRLVVLAKDDDHSSAIAAARAGAMAWVHRRTTVDEVLHIVRNVGHGRAFYPREVLGVVLRALRADVVEVRDFRGPFMMLSEREREVLTALAGGRTGREIAADLSMSYNTFRTHTNEIFRKLGVHSRLQAVRLAHLADAGNGRPVSGRAQAGHLHSRAASRTPG